MDNSYLNDGRLFLQGSPTLDLFKRLHKNADKTFWSSDVDFVWVAKNPYRIIAVLEVKNKDTDSGYTFAESVACFCLIEKGIVVYLVKLRATDSYCYDIDVHRVSRIDPKPQPPIWYGRKILSGVNWDDFMQWQKSVREEMVMSTETKPQ